jgi:hypothetical protein
MKTLQRVFYLLFFVGAASLLIGLFFTMLSGVQFELACAFGTFGFSLWGLVIFSIIAAIPAPRLAAKAIGAAFLLFFTCVVAFVAMFQMS